MSNTCVGTSFEEVRMSFKMCRFVGNPKETKGGLLYDPQENSVYIEKCYILRGRPHKRSSHLAVN